MDKKRLIEIGVLIGCGLFFLILGLHVYWINYFDHRSQFFLLGTQDTNLFAIQLFIGVFIPLGSVITIFGGLRVFRVKVFWWRISSVLLLVSLLLPWWQWGFRWQSMSLITSGGGVVSAHNFLFGFLRTSHSLFMHWHEYVFTSGTRFVLYLVLERSSTYSSPLNDIHINGPWLTTLLVRVLCYFIFGLILSSSVLGWPSKKRRRLIGAMAGCVGVILFMAWIFLAWSAFGLEWYYGCGENPCFIFVPGFGYSFLSFGFFSAVTGIIALTLSLLTKMLRRSCYPIGQQHLYTLLCVH